MLEQLEVHAPRLVSRVAALLGLALLADVLLPDRVRGVAPVAAFLPNPARATADAVVAVAGWVLLRIARGLGKRKSTEWRAAVAACAAVTAADALRTDRRPIEAGVTALLLVTLLLTRRQFTARADPRGRWYALRVAAGLLGVAFGYGLTLLYLPGHVGPRIGLLDRLHEILASLVGLGGWIPIRGDHYADMVHATLLLFGLLTAVTTTVFLLRPVEPPATLGEDDEDRLRGLLAAHGARDSLGYFALRRDKLAVWSTTGKAAVSYRVTCGVALASGDPIGDPEAWPGAIAAFRALVDQHGWTPAVIGCSELGATVYLREYGLPAMLLGDEAVVRAATFTLAGRAMRGVRQACAKLARCGYTVTVRRTADVDDEDLAAVRAAAAVWRGEPVERGFSMALSRLGDRTDPDCLLVTAHQDGVLRGVLHFVPWSDDGVSLDLMRRDRNAENGVNELMISGLMAACDRLGIERVSLNFAVFRDALERGGRIGAGPVLRLQRRVLLIASRWWQIDSLYRFNDKFAPVWVPRFLSYPRARDLPRIALAALTAEAFVVAPASVRRLLGRPALPR